MSTATDADLLVVGGGINGAGIARDAAGRGLRVVLVERGDLGSATSSASSKLIHGGLRYLEQLEFRLVAEALGEREVLLRAAPHIVHPLCFIMPHVQGLRPAWVVRAGLFLYDWLARRDTLPASTRVDFTKPPYNDALKRIYDHGFAYSDCWVDDARLVIASVHGAADLGARILTRTACIAAQREGLRWRARLKTPEGETELLALALVNAAGPWVGDFLTRTVGNPSPPPLKLVQGSHIVVPRLYTADHAFILQNDDRRVVFVYPYQRDYTLIGTTDVAFDREPGSCRASSDEIDYLCRAVSRYFVREVRPADVVWSYCGVRALVDDGSREPSRVTRDYLLRVDGDATSAPVLSVFGGKITTYRRLAERALERLNPWFPTLGKPWTAHAPLPGGDIPRGDVDQYCVELQSSFARLPLALLRALVHRHGSRVRDVLDNAADVNDLGECFGADLYAREVDYFMTREWAREADDVLWRRSKAGLHLSPEQQAKVHRYMAKRVAAGL